MVEEPLQNKFSMSHLAATQTTPFNAKEWIFHSIITPHPHGELKLCTAKSALLKKEESFFKGFFFLQRSKGDTK